MLSDLDCANLCLSLYDGEAIFDYSNRIDQVSFAIKNYADCTAVVFKGSYNIPDWISNFQALMVYIKDLGGVEMGFFDGMHQTRMTVMPMLDPEKKIYVTGHSRGAAHAHIFAAMLINAGYQVEVVVFGSPRPGDASLARILQKAPNRSYRNYEDWDTQDWVTDVPLDFKIVSPYMHPVKQIQIRQVPADPDPWGILKMHHIQNYIQWLKENSNAAN